MLLGERTYTVTERGAYTVVNGRMVPGASTTFDIRASIQPVPGRVRETLPEGIREAVQLMCYTRSTLRGPDQGTGLPPHRVTYRGEEYDVADSQPWHDGPLPHFAVALVRAAEAGGRP